MNPFGDSDRPPQLGPPRPPLPRDRERVSPETLALERRASLLVYPHSDPFTCDDCPRAPICHFAFDPYNTNGDCLDDK